MSRHERNLDLSSLKGEEASAIRDVLERDKLLKKRDSDRLERIQQGRRVDHRWLKGVSGQWFQEVQRAKHSHRLGGAPCTEPSPNSQAEKPEAAVRSGRLLADRSDRHRASVTPSRVSLRSRVTSLLTFPFLQKAECRLRGSSLSHYTLGSDGSSSGNGDQADVCPPRTEQVKVKATTCVERSHTTAGTPVLKTKENWSTNQREKKSTVLHKPSSPLLHTDLSSPGCRPFNFKCHGDSRNPRTGTGRRLASVKEEEPTNSNIKEEVDLCPTQTRLWLSATDEGLCPPSPTALINSSTVSESLQKTASGTYPENTSDSQKNSSFSKHSTLLFPSAPNCSGLKRSTSLPCVQSQRDENPPSNLPTGFSSVVTMLPSALMTVLAPPWTGRFRRHKQGIENHTAGPEVSEKDREVRWNSGVYKQQQTPGPKESFRASQIVHGSETQQKPMTSSATRSTVSWLPKSSPTTLGATPQSPLSKSFVHDISETKGKNRGQSSSDAVMSAAHSATSHSSSVDLQHHSRVSPFSRQERPQFKEHVLPSSYLSFRASNSGLGSAESHSSFKSGPSSSFNPGSTTGHPGQTYNSQTSDTGSKPDRLHHLKMLYRTRATTLPWREHSQKDAVAPTGRPSVYLGRSISCYDLSGETDMLDDANHNINMPSINYRNNLKTSNSDNKGPTLNVLQVRNTHNNPTVHHSSSVISPTSPYSTPITPASPNSSSVAASPVCQQFSPSRIWTLTDMTPMSPSRKENASTGGQVNTCAAKENLDNCSRAIRRSRFQRVSDSRMPLTSLTSPINSPLSPDSSFTDSPMAKSYPKFIYNGKSPISHSPMSLTSSRSSVSSPVSEDSSTTSPFAVFSPKSSYSVDYRVIHNSKLSDSPVLPVQSVSSMDISRTKSPVCVTKKPNTVDTSQSDNLKTSSLLLRRSAQSANDVSTKNKAAMTTQSSPTRTFCTVDSSVSHSLLVQTRPSDVDDTSVQNSDGPTTDVRSLNCVNNSKTENSATQTGSVLQHSQSKNTNTCTTQSLKGLTSSVAPPNPSTSFDIKSTDDTDNLNSHSATPLNCTVLKTRPIRSVDGPITYSSLRQSSALQIISPTQRSPDPNSKCGELKDTPPIPSLDVRPVSWRHHYFYNNNPVIATNEEKHLHKLKSLSVEDIHSKNSSGDISETSSDLLIRQNRSMVNKPLTSSSKNCEDEVLTSRKTCTKEELPSCCRIIDVVSCSETEGISKVLTSSDRETKVGKHQNITQYRRPQAQWLSTEAIQPTEECLEADRCLGGSYYRTDKNGSSIHLSESTWTPVKKRSFSLDSNTVISGPRKYSITLRASQQPYDADWEDTDNENVFYNKGDLKRESKRKKAISFSELDDHQAFRGVLDCSGMQIMEDDNIRNQFRSLSLKNIHDESERYSCSSSDFSLKGRHSFPVSNVRASRPTGYVRMATVPRMASVDSLTCMGVSSDEQGGLRRQPKALSCTMVQGAHEEEKWKLVNTNPVWLSQSMEKADCLQDKEPPSSSSVFPPCSSPVMSPTHRSSSVSSLTSQGSLSPRGRLPSRGYKSSLSTFDESDIDTTTDDEYYFGSDKGEKETEL